MKSSLRIALLLMLPIAADLSAQQPTPAVTSTATATDTTAATATAPARSVQTSQEIRDDFSTLLHNSPSELGTILTLDPTLLSNEAFLSGYPSLQAFINEHPEVRRNPHFYLSGFELQDGRNTFMEDVLQGLVIFLSFLVTAFALGWLVRTIIEQRRWNRLSRTQSEVHNKILDRFGSSEELLAYIKSPAGAKFLESAPIPLHAGQSLHSAPVARIMWSVQVGVVIAAGALGALFVSGNFDAETARGISAIGVIALCLGMGFILSSFVSMFFSRRLGLWKNEKSMNIEESMS